MGKFLKHSKDYSIEIIMVVIFVAGIIYAAGSSSKNIEVNTTNITRIETQMDTRFTRQDNALIRIENKIDSID